MEKMQLAIYRLLKHEPFFASFLLNSNLVWDTPGIPTAYATIRNGTTVIGMNSEFASKLSLNEFIAVLKHEILHLLFDHVNPSLYEVKNRAKRHNWNIAMDCAINQYIGDLPEGAVTLEALSKSLKKDLAPFQSTQYYYNEIENAPDELKQKVMSIDTLDEHGEMENLSPEDAQLAKSIVSKVAQSALKESKGNVSSDLVKAIAGLLPPARVNWKQVLRNFVSRATSRKTQATRKKTNRRFGFEHPGKKKKQELKLAVCIDTSGSISDKAFEMFVSEIKDIAKNTCETHLIYADCVVQKTVKITDQKKVPMERFGAGGTAYQSAITKAVELKCDAILYLGDMDTSDVPENPKKPFLWVIVGHQDPPVNWGDIVRLSEDNI